MICTEFTVSNDEDVAYGIGPDLRVAVRDLLERELRDDSAFPLLSSVGDGKLRLNLKIGPVEAVFEETLEQTFESFLDPIADEKRGELAELLEGLARRIRDAEAERRGPEPEDFPA